MVFEFLKQDNEDNQELIQPQQKQQSIWDTKEYLEFVKHYSEDETIPTQIKGTRWGIFGKALIYTFLDDKDLIMVDYYSKILRCDSLMEQPPHKISWVESGNLDQQEFYMYLSAKRAIGTNREKMNERTLQNTQIMQSIAAQTTGIKRQSGGGFFSRLKNVF